MKFKKIFSTLFVTFAIAAPVLTGCTQNNPSANNSNTSEPDSGSQPGPGPIVSEYAIAMSGDAKVGERVTFVLNKNGNPYSGEATFALKSAADAEYLEFKDATTVECKKEGKATVVAKVNNEVVAELELNIAKSSVLGIKEAFEAAIKEAPFNGSAGNASAKTETTYTIAGKVVAIPVSKATSDATYDGTILIDDGEEICPLVVYGQKSNLKAKVGDSVQVSVKFTNYYGVLEGIAPVSTADKQNSLYPDQLNVINRTFKTQSFKEFSAADFASYYTEAKANGANGSTKYTSIKPIKIEQVKGAGGTGKDAMMTLEGDTCECSGKINITSTDACQVDNTEGKYSNVEGYMVGGNSSSKYLKMTVTRQYQSAPTSATITSETGDLVVAPGNKLQLIANFLPAGAAEAAVKWYSLDESIATVDEDTGEVTGVSNGYVCIQAKVEGLLFPVYTFIQVDSNPCVKVELSQKTAELVNVEGVTLELTATRTARKADKPCGDEIVWSSSNEAVATVDNGVVTKVGVGQTTITATCGNAVAECKVTVRTQTLKDLEDGIDTTKTNVYGYYIGGYENGTVKGYWIADGDRGMYIYGSPLANVQVGSIIHVVGAISNYNGGKQINPTKQEIVADAPVLLAAPKTLVIDETNVGTLDAKTQGRLASVTGKVKSAPTKTVYGTDNCTYTVEIAEGKEMTVYLHKSYPSEANYNDAAGKLKKGYTVTVTGYVSAYKSNSKDLSTVPASAYQLLNPKVLSSEAPVITGIALDKTSATIKQGESLQLAVIFTPSEAESGDVVWSVEGNNKVTVEQDGTVKVAKDAVVGSTATVKATLGNLVATCTVTVAQGDATALSKATSIAIGDKIILAVETATVKKQFGGISGTIGSAIDYTGSTPDGSKNRIEVVAGYQEGTYALKVGNNSYLMWDSGNSLKTKSAIDANSSWLITFNGEAVTIRNAADNNRRLQYNASSPRFCCYTSNQTAVTLWK